jgi:hypothetical protein
MLFTDEGFCLVGNASANFHVVGVCRIRIHTLLFWQKNSEESLKSADDKISYRFSIDILLGVETPPPPRFWNSPMLCLPRFSAELRHCILFGIRKRNMFRTH